MPDKGRNMRITRIVAALGFGALVLPAFAVESPEELRFSARAFQCQSLEFAEIDAMPAIELQGAFCSYDLGAKRSSKRMAEAKEKYQGNHVVISGLLSDHIRTLGQCTAGMEKVSDTLRRKHAAKPADCAKMHAELEARMDAAKR
ncbi:hypothetical protein LE190_16045 [Massilia oculi]|uniref:Uncharacterized protein n=1 Tax=Massilia hydrophila TaxID=3044279 RepID=A0ABS7YCJ9_9BURK|nr:hypothetical protein [Massilia oculi]MCA1857425.1 hypothetical protein [Massilia oculi]